MIGNHDAVGTDIGRCAGVFGVQNSLDDDGSFPGCPDPLDVLPKNRRIEIVAKPTHVVVEPAGLAEHGHEVPELMRSSAHSNIPCPSGLTERLVHSSQRGSRT